MPASSDRQPRPRRFTTATQTSRRKQAIRELSDRLAPERDRWIARNTYFHDEDIRYMRFLIPEGLSVLDLGCGTGRLLAALKPARGVGIDFSSGMIDVARRNCPDLEFRVGDVEDPSVLAALDGPFDVIVLSDTIGSLNDCQSMLGNLHGLCSRDTRLVIAYYSSLWEPVLTLAEKLGLKMPQEPQNYLSAEDIAEILALADFEVIRREWRQLVPVRFFGLGPLLNRYIGTLPLIRHAGLRNIIVARSLDTRGLGAPSTTVVIPCKNERGNIEPAVQRLPQFCEDLEILFVEGGSRDGTLEEIHRVIAAYPERDVKVVQQDRTGKGDAVRQGFSVARGEVLMILDADLTVPPEWLPRFYDALAEGKGEFINGTRMIYPLEKQAMRLLNYVANRVFSWLFTWLLNQRFTDTLCGTKVLSKRNYEKIAAHRAYFGDFDPFGDFDLIFGATKLNLKVIEVPVRYGARTYGETQISRFAHGWLLLRMVALAYRKLKAF